MRIAINGITIDDFTLGFLTAALWAGTDSKGEPLDRRFSVSDIPLDVLKEAVADCADFKEANYQDIEAYCAERAIPRDADYSVMECAGHDFLLTRNRHGAGFWDRGFGELGDRLTAASHPYGSFDRIMEVEIECADSESD